MPTARSQIRSRSWVGATRLRPGSLRRVDHREDERERQLPHHEDDDEESLPHGRSGATGAGVRARRERRRPGRARGVHSQVGNRVKLRGMPTIRRDHPECAADFEVTFFVTIILMSMNRHFIKILPNYKLSKFFEPPFIFMFNCIWGFCPICIPLEKIIYMCAFQGCIGACSHQGRGQTCFWTTLAKSSRCQRPSPTH